MRAQRGICSRTQICRPDVHVLRRCCYITVDSAMAASQNGFCFYKLTIRKKTNIIHTMTKNITIFINIICYHREIVKLDHFMTLSLSYANTVLWCSRFKIHRFVAAPLRTLGNGGSLDIFSLYKNITKKTGCHFKDQGARNRSWRINYLPDGKLGRFTGYAPPCL